MADVRIGTSGYDYGEWVGAELFYPPSLAQQRRDWLTYYASRFPVAELNFTYYGETTPAQLEGMLERVQPERALHLLEGTFAPRQDFEFVIKAYASLTHRITADWPAEARRFMAHIAPLSASGKLLGVLAQFAPALTRTNKAEAFVAELAEALRPARLIAEFRHGSWFDADVVESLAAAGIVFTLVDTPPEVGLPNLAVRQSANESGSWPRRMLELADFPAVDGIRYVRLHGRNAGHWYGGDGHERYNFDYPPGELETLGRAALRGAGRTYLLFNNCHGAQAAQNAELLERMMTRLQAERFGE